MSEATISAAIITAIKTIAAFGDADVVDADYSILDGAMEGAPYVIVGVSDAFTSRQDVQTPTTVWDLPITLIEAFTDWTTSLKNLRTRRQALIDEINSDDTRSAGGLTGIDITELRSEGPILPVFDADMDPEITYDADPMYLMHPMVLVCQEF